MYPFQGLGTTHIVVNDEAGKKETLKVRIHHLTLKLHEGRVCAFWKEFMRDELLLPADGNGWPVFKDGADLSLSGLETMKTLPIANIEGAEKRIQVRQSAWQHCPHALKRAPQSCCSARLPDQTSL